jgi:hypothetical protein
MVDVQRVLALCDFWDLEKVALAKNRIRQIGRSKEINGPKIALAKYKTAVMK